MNSAIEGLREHLAQPVTTVCHCWRLTRRDGTVRGYTDHDSPIHFEETSFQPDGGFNASEARDRLGLGIDTGDIDGALRADDLNDDEIANGVLDGATVETFLVDWSNPSNRLILRRSIVGKIIRRDGLFTAELQSLTESLDRVNGRYVRRSCDATLGDARCGVSLVQPGLRLQGTVVRTDGRDGLVVAGLDGVQAGWFSHGRLTWTSGDNTGVTEHVLDHARRFDGVSLTLWRDGTRISAIGDAFEVTVGCDKQFATCKAKFANQLNFRGFPHLPGNDAAYGYVTGGVVFDGATIVP